MAREWNSEHALAAIDTAMTPNRLFEDDDVLFGLPSSDRESHVELKIDRVPEPPSTERELSASDEYGDLVPYFAIAVAELTRFPLDSREGFLLSRIDECSTIDAILDVCAMPPDEALEILASFVDRGIIALRR
jgi:hypothetical protein